jgi:hypothetical protein
VHRRANAPRLRRVADNEVGVSLDLSIGEIDSWDLVESYSTIDAEQQRLDLVRIRGYAMACIEVAVRSRKELDSAVAKLMAAREVAEAAAEHSRLACEHAARMGTFATRAMAGDVDPDTLAEAAIAIEEMIG